MNLVTTKVKSEPVLFWTVISAIFNTAQALALPVAPWLHIVILIVAHTAATLAARNQVTPTAAN